MTNRKIKFRQLKRVLFVLTSAVTFCVSVSFAQTSPIQTVPPIAENQIVAAEDFELNIVDERITETNFVRSTSVELKSKNRGELVLQVGVAVRGEKVNILLRGVVGRVRFRASLEPIQQRLEQIRRSSPKK